MTTCLARKKKPVRFLFFRFFVSQSHEWRFSVMVHRAWTWEVTWVCKHCGAEHVENINGDEEMMLRVGLRKRPKDKGWPEVYGKKDLQFAKGRR